MAIALASGTATANASSGTSVSVAAPTGLADTDLWVIRIALRAVGAVDVMTTPSGWTKLAQASNVATAGTAALYARKWVTGAPTSETISWVTSSQNSYISERYTGQDLTTFSDVAASTNGATSGTTATATGIAVATDGAMLIGVYAANSGTATYSSYTSPLVENADIGANQSLAGANGLQAALGASGDKSCTISADRAWVAILWAIRPAVAAGGSIVPILMAQYRNRR